ncbi:MAG: glycosyltransferase family A protein [Thermomicrobiales bacterium]
MPLVDVLIPTCSRKTGLAVVLASLFSQTFRDFRVVISDQTTDDETYMEDREIRTLLDALRWHGHLVEVHRHLPRQGMAEQRHFLLTRANARYVHYLDDDVLLEPDTMERMLGVIQHERCGFVGCPATGLDYLDDIRPHQQQIEVWSGPVVPEQFDSSGIPWQRISVNNAANPLHLEQQLAPDRGTVRYKVAWVGGANVLFDREKLLAVGGFAWWHELPPNHAGEEVVVQFLLLNRFGGCGLLPAGTYHLGLPTNVPDRTHNATALFDSLSARLNGSDGPLTAIQTDGKEVAAIHD